MSEKKRRPLSEVVKERRQAEECLLCIIPEREEIERERAAGADIKDIATWLVKDCGYDEARVTRERQRKMTKHFASHVESSNG